MYRKSVASFDAAVPAITTRIEANLISLRGIDPDKANPRRTNDKCVAVNNSRHPREISGLSTHTYQYHCGQRHYAAQSHCCPRSTITPDGNHYVCTAIII